MDLGLGKLITTDQARDAIHIAVAPVVAAEKMAPGTHVGLVEGGVGPSPNPIGIIDPFLPHFVEKGQKCWLFLYPNTVTSLRHEWTHPAFLPQGEVAESRQWIEDFAASIDQTYNRLMEAADLWLQYGEYTRDDSESYKDRWGDFGEFWKHYEIVTGKTVECEKDSFFTCSC